MNVIPSSVPSCMLVASVLLLGSTACVIGDPGPSAGHAQLAADRPKLLRDNLLANLRAVMGSDTSLFGQQRFNVTGIADGGGQWIGQDGALDRSDVRTLTGQHPAVLGLDAWDLAMKPASWAPNGQLHAAAVRQVYAAGGVVTMDWHMRGCNSDVLDGAGFKPAGNEACLCQLANDDAFATSWLVEGRLARFADALATYGLTDVPIIFRPMHEMTGDWFWWGYPYWDCGRWLPGSTVTGPAAYQKVFRRIVDYLRGERHLDNLAIAYSPDKLDRGIGADPEARYLAGYPGDAYVDVLGIDLYWMSDDFAAETARYRDYLAVVTKLARARGKVAALTETGNYRLAGETRAADSTWFGDHLLPLMKGDATVQLAYALVWENRQATAYEIYVPAAGHPGEADFRSFAASPITQLLGDNRDLYASPGGATSPNSPATPPLCASCYADADGDGVGVEGGAVCLASPGCAAPTPTYPTCASCASDPDGDGWGWENEGSCIVAASCSAPAPMYPTCARCDSDPDGDGWGWENSQSCVVAAAC